MSSHPREQSRVVGCCALFGENLAVLWISEMPWRLTWVWGPGFQSVDEWSSLFQSLSQEQEASTSCSVWRRRGWFRPWEWTAERQGWWMLAISREISFPQFSDSQSHRNIWQSLPNPSSMENSVRIPRLPIPSLIPKLKTSEDSLMVFPCLSYFIIFFEYQDEPSASKDFFVASIKSIGLSITLLLLSLLSDPLCIPVSISMVQYLDSKLRKPWPVNCQLHRWPPLKKLTKSLKKNSPPRCWRLHP